MEETELYFAFGSNLSARKMRERGTRFISRESAVLRGFRVVFSIWKDDGFGYANIIPDKESTVYGALYICLKKSLATHEAVSVFKFQYRNIKLDRIFGSEVKPWIRSNNFGSLARTLDLRNKNVGSN